jgi:hypothetical protein
VQASSRAWIPSCWSEKLCGFFYRKSLNLVFEVYIFPTVGHEKPGSGNALGIKSLVRGIRV